jgi:DNA-binding transcriptional MerR regulator
MNITKSPDSLTIDDLAQRSGVPSSTIRLYQSKGLLAAPTRTGRVGYYGPEHLDRLRLIGQLQEDGFSLAGIGRLLQASKEGRALDEVLGLKARVAQTWSGSQPLEITFQELADRFPDGLPAEFAERALDLGLVRLEGEHLIIDDSRFLDVGSELAGIGVPLSEVLDEFELLKTSLTPIADRFTELFRRHIWTRFVNGGLRPEELPSLIANLERLNHLASDIVTGTLEAALRESAESFLIKESETIRKAEIEEVLASLVKAAGLNFPVKP